MAFLPQKQQGQNTITGKVILKETGVGIPDVLVVLYDLDPGAKPDENFSNAATSTDHSIAAPGNLLGDRIGSVLTEQDGSWQISYEDAEFRLLTPGEKRPDIQLMILAPEDADSDKPPFVLFNSRLLRINSGRLESYIIRLSEKQLKEGQVPVPTDKETTKNTESKIQEFRLKKQTQKDLRDGIRQINKEFETVETTELKDLKTSFRKAILPNADILNSMYNFVKDADTIAEVQKKVFKSGADSIDGKINNIDPNNPVPGKGIKVNLILTDDDKNNLQQFKFSFNGKDYYNIPESKIQQLLFKQESDDGINAILFSNNPVSKFCIQKSTDEKCALAHTDLPGGSDDHDGTNNAGNDSGGGTENSDTEATGLTTDDIPVYLQKIMSDKNATPYLQNKDYKSQRPDSKTVQSNIDNFALQKGPADTTAFYDFHSLQIAFEHVWQQLLDETLVNLAEQIHTDQENTGKKGLLQSIADKLANVRQSAFNLVLSTTIDCRRINVEQVPTEISSAFDISFLEYDALSNDDKEKLASLARDINKYETITPQQQKQLNMDVWWQNTFIQQITPDYATMALLLRDQGERIIDNVRNNKPFTTNQLLKELQDRLLSKYEFTVFAADKDYHSINFGLVNTYRQRWDPISYQAGKLVKTIPLSPKEERKYSVKISQSTKFTKKQAIKNNSSLQQEITSTSRAESEIIAKAQDKSNFNLSVKLDYSKITSELSFGKEAEKESSQSKKEFREAVIKATQEFKEERSIDIETETNITTEYNESGSIVNPNDELSVTYLFYELQRRYRISEQLYRVMPVVLVAQQVPSPDQINEGWIIANDWIINRALLDDSYRDALRYIGQKNVGDDFAIRELRKNLRQQRTLVNNLQLEFSKLKQDVENKYAAMERAVNERISEEHIKRTYRWWWWWNRSDRPDSPPDPEMAKALEQAATDEHKYAVEKAEKMALSVQREVNALNQLTSNYNEVMREHLDHLTQIRRLITHIKENILYYMQAIWSMEPPDQRYMRLYKVKVPSFEAERTCIIQDVPVEDFFEAFREPGKKKHVAWLHGKIKRNQDGTPDVGYKQLVEVADIDTMMGFKGNYMIFPLKEHNALTELMAAPFVDEAFGAMDPDQLSNINLEEYSKYICCLHDNDPDKFEELKLVLRKWLEQLLADPLRNGDEIIIPTGSLFIEMLPSDKSLLEDFKLKHREWDVYKVQAEVRGQELENIRYAARLLKDEREDPKVDKKIIIEQDVSNGLDINT